MNARVVAIVLLLVAAGCFAGIAGTAAASAPAPGRSPAGLREEVLLAGAIVGRSRLDLHRFEDPRSPEAVMSAVQAAWAERPAPLQRADRAGWLTLVQAVDDAVEVLEVRASSRGGSEGRRSRWRGASPGAEPPGAWLEDFLPPGSRVLQQVTHRDGGRQTTTLVVLTDAGLATAAGQVAAALGRAGFKRTTRALPAFSGQGEAFFLLRQREEVAVTVSELGGRRAVVLHWGRPSP